MSRDLLTGEILKGMIVSATSVLRDNKSTVDALNVFPVPDGDTGTNMSLTMLSASQETDRVKDPTVQSVAEAVALGSLMGARGNSGVILSQLFRGIARGLSGHDTCDSAVLAAALEEGVQTAYKAVMKPVEGTILTVAREAARGASVTAKKGGSIADVWQAACRAAEAILAKTPEMLPVLKQARVVDAGGKGLVFVLSGALSALRNESRGVVSVGGGVTEVPAGRLPEFHVTEEMGDIQNPYDTQLLVKGTDILIDELRSRLEALGDSLLVVGSSEVVRVHVHTQEPDKVLQICLSYGSLSGVTIDNMIEQHDEFRQASHGAVPAQEAPPEEIKDIGMVAVASGSGIIEVMKSLGVDHVIDGGQTMNPSTEDVVNALKAVKAKKVIFLPNNKNIFLAAKQAKRFSGRRMYVVPTRNIPQGIAAALALHPDGTMEDNLKRMARALRQVKSGEITYAVRKSHMNGFSINEGDILGIWDGEIALTGNDPVQVLIGLLDKMVTENDEIITVFHGNGFPQETAAQLGQLLGERFSSQEIEIREGGQPLYYFIVSVE